ncbi:CoA-binding protein [Chloroflexota bacterium]
MNQNRGLEQAFHPKAIAIVGVSRTEGNSPPGYTGMMFLQLLQKAKFEGRIYPINPKADTIAGLKAYPSVSSVPEHVDYVIVTVPAAAVPGVLEDCATARALDVLVCTAGFGETGEEEGKTLDSVIYEIALKGGLRVVGPNSLGYHVPSARMGMYIEASLKPGPVAFVSQSGGHCQMYTRQGPSQGIAFSKVISYGNALLMDSTDYLEHLANDPETGIICMYVEDVRDGKRFKELVTRVNPLKPVIIWKGGLTPWGARAALTHTGSMAGDKQVWDAFFKQTGAMSVDSIDEMADLTMTFLRLKPLSGRRVLVWGGGGGNTVAAGDVCAWEGLELPSLSEQTRVNLMEFMTLVNQIIVNPIDAVSGFFDTDVLRRGLETAAADPNIDIIIIHLSAGTPRRLPKEIVARVRDIISELSHRAPSGKPVVVAVREDGKPGEGEEYVDYLREADITTYSSPARACRALSKFAAYHSFINQQIAVA